MYEDNPENIINVERPMNLSLGHGPNVQQAPTDN